ncbi:MAG: HDIG domain-containing protein [Lachnoclostridium sp.]|jgi:HD-GYP domain-containing protein (c-di-GMP phosphodiesterase class II)
MMDIISSKNVINLIRKTLNLIDKRLIHHGERISYILNKMLVCENKYSTEEIFNFTIIGLLHDIGAYKTEEIDKMIQFETNGVFEHSIYGNLFLKYLSPLGDLAEIVLYHHMDYYKLKQLSTVYERVASYLNLADRVDVYFMHFKNASPDQWIAFERNKFSKEALELLKRTDEKYKIFEHIRNKTYLDELNQIYSSVKFTPKDKEAYIKMLIYSIDFRSEFTVMHTITTVSIADEIGKLMNLTDYERKILHYGAILHDIGKIATPVSILEAPRKLTENEMAIMKNHVKMSEFILNDYIHPDILEIAIRHHERLDGSGYHRGLTAKDLTLPQRILAVSDVISALYGKRSYKEPFQKDTILNILSKEAKEGKLCPFTIECVSKNFDEIMYNVTENTAKPLKVYGDIKKKYEETYYQLLEFCKEKN